jgi:hypothetical protein
MEIKAIIERWGRRYDANVLRAMMWLPEVKGAQIEEAAHMRAWSAQLEELLKASNGTGPRYRVHYQPGGSGVEPALYVTREYHGLTTTKNLQPGFFRSPEYQRVATIGSSFKDLVSVGAAIERGKDRKDVGTFPEAVDWLMHQAKQGQSIQRYKGLGEMNPSQLWETTVNPETRRLMQVRIEDAVAADVSGSEGLRDAGIGCAAAEKTQSALRHGVYKLVSRRRPLTEEGEPDPWDFDVPGGDWEHHSFFGGHGANIMTCASFINYRFDLGWAEPAIMALAVGVNIGRVVDRRHWASDAFVGAAVGVAIGKAFADRQLERRRDRTGVESEGGAGRSGGIDVGTRDGVVYLGWRQWF